MELCYFDAVFERRPILDRHMKMVLTEHRGVVVSIPVSYSRDSEFKFRLGDRLQTGFRGYPEFLHANAWILPQIRTKPLISTSFPFNYSLIILAIDAKQS
jgi:hypothetical protein